MVCVASLALGGPLHRGEFALPGDVAATAHHMSHGLIRGMRVLIDGLLSFM